MSTQTNTITLKNAFIQFPLNDSDELPRLYADGKEYYFQLSALYCPVFQAFLQRLESGQISDMPDGVIVNEITIMLYTYDFLGIHWKSRFTCSWIEEIIIDSTGNEMSSTQPDDYHKLQQLEQKIENLQQQLKLLTVREVSQPGET